MPFGNPQRVFVGAALLLRATRREDICVRELKKLAHIAEKKTLLSLSAARVGKTWSTAQTKNMFIS